MDLCVELIPFIESIIKSLEHIMIMIITIMNDLKCRN